MMLKKFNKVFKSIISILLVFVFKNLNRIILKIQNILTILGQSFIRWTQKYAL